MFELKTSIARPSAYELHLHARRARGQAIGMLSRHAVSKFADWLCMLVYNGGARLTRQLAAEHRLRRDIRMLVTATATAPRAVTSGPTSTPPSIAASSRTAR